jgi:hypothetical protein
MSKLEEKEKELEKSRLNHAILDYEFKILKKEEEIERMKDSINKYKTIMEEKGLNNE